MNAHRSHAPSHPPYSPGPKPVAAATALPSPEALGWLGAQSHDVIDRCLSQLNPADLNDCGARWLQATMQSKGLLPPNAKALTLRLAARQWQHVAQQIPDGPLKTALVEGLQPLRDGGHSARSWLHTTVSRGRLTQLADLMHQQLLVTAYHPHQSVPRDNTVALMVLDVLESGSPCADVIMTHMGLTQDVGARARARRRAGRRALILASTLSAAMQHTSLAHMLVGTALSYLGRRAQAEEVVCKGAMGLLRHELSPIGAPVPLTYFGSLRGHTSRPGEYALRWLHSAALAADSPLLYDQIAIGRELVRTAMPPAAPWMRSSGRWPLLEPMGAPHREACVTWCYAAGAPNMAEHLQRGMLHRHGDERPTSQTSVGS